MGYPSYNLTFNSFQEKNARRCREAFDENLHTVEFFCIAIAGEAGEMCNEYKKVMRGDYELEHVREKIIEEVADIMTYCDLMMTKLGANTEEALVSKFAKVSNRRDGKDDSRITVR